MNIDTVRISRYLAEIRKGAGELDELVTQRELNQDPVALKAAKYLLIELAEAMANTLQHILAKVGGIPVSGYIDTIVKGHQHGLLSGQLFNELKPFMDFRNSLVHRYWIVDDVRLIENITAGRRDFFHFADEVEAYLLRSPADE